MWYSSVKTDFCVCYYQYAANKLYIEMNAIDGLHSAYLRRN